MKTKSFYKAIVVLAKLNNISVSKLENLAGLGCGTLRKRRYKHTENQSLGFDTVLKILQALKMPLKKFAILVDHIDRNEIDTIPRHVFTRIRR